jgi:hypothetical protein
VGELTGYSRRVTLVGALLFALDEFLHIGSEVLGHLLLHERGIDRPEISPDQKEDLGVANRGATAIVPAFWPWALKI